MDVYEHYAESVFLDNEELASRHASKKFIKKIDEIKAGYRSPAQYS